MARGGRSPISVATIIIKLRQQNFFLTELESSHQTEQIDARFTEPTSGITPTSATVTADLRAKRPRYNDTNHPVSSPLPAKAGTAKNRVGVEIPVQRRASSRSQFKQSVQANKQEIKVKSSAHRGCRQRANSQGQVLCPPGAQARKQAVKGAQTT